MKRKLLFVFLISILLLAACVQTAPATSQDINSIVQATFVALTVQAAVSNSAAPTATPTTLPSGAGPAPVATATGSISGTLSYPSEGIPPLLIVAFNNTTGHYYWVKTAQDQTTYQLDGLPAGPYYVYAYTLPNGKLVGAYDQFYLCGMHQGCNDLSLIEVNVQAGQVTGNVNPGDWYGDLTQFPPMPNVDNPQALNTQPAAFGSVAGSLNYPSEGNPAMTIVAFNQTTPGNYYYVLTNAGQNSYQIDNLPPGDYIVVAYLRNNAQMAGGFTQAVPCGLTVACTDHSPATVTVTSGQVTTGIDMKDWFPPAGTFPANPVP